MGKKSRAKRRTGDGEDAADAEDDPGADAASHVSELLEALRLDDAAAAADEGLKATPESRALAELRDMAAELARYFEADGVRAEVGTSHGRAEVGAEPATSSERGRGLVTTRRFRRGEVIVQEAPCLIASRKVVTSGSAESPAAFDRAAVREASQALRPVQRRLLAAFQDGMESLPAGMAEMIKADSSAEPLVRLARIMKLNAHEYYQEPGKAALYPLIARANHSCDPCCGLAAADGGKLFFYALRDLEVGDEVDYSYLGGHFTLHPTAVRRRQLLQTKLFECACSRCLAPELSRQPPCGSAEKCEGFLQPAAEASDGRWRCCLCSLEEEDGSERLARYRRLEPMLLTKVDALEAKWHDPSKDVAKYIGDWEALAKSCGQMLGARHHAYARACFFALQALNTGLSLKLGGVDAARHAGGLRHYGLPLARYLRACCPRGVRCVSLEPVGAALVLIAQAPEHRALATEVVREAGRNELRLPLFDSARNSVLAKLVDEVAEATDIGGDSAG